MRHEQPRLSRRTALKSATGLVLGLCLKPGSGLAQSGLGQRLSPHGSTRIAFAPNAFVRIGSDDTVTVLVKHIEFGQGPFTGLATIVAEELDADWSKIRAEHAPADLNLYKNTLLGVQGTGGSTSIANSYEQLRKAGAAARTMLVEAAAQSWRVPASEISVERGVLRHAKSNRLARFGQFAEAAAKLPVPENPPLKDPSKFRLIGREGAVKKLDVPAKTNGTAQFTIDVREPGTLTVVVAHPPRFGSKVASVDATEARAVPGVVDVKQIPSGIAVYADSTWPALKARETLKITWDESAAEKRSSSQLIEEYRALSRQKGNTASQHGDVDAALAGAERVIETEFVFPYLSRAPLRDPQFPLRRAHAFGRRANAVVALGRAHPHRLCGRMFYRRASAGDRAGPDRRSIGDDGQGAAGGWRVARRSAACPLDWAWPVWGSGARSGGGRKLW
jgi:isoquinoline 1-oxidoreductase subunit beta